ncbi:MAG: LamG-like jellyroll fold domain-containing protein, partial [Paludibacteraceae bacterium]
MAAQKENGTMRHIATARNLQGELRHLVVAPKLTLDMVQDATFCYTQEHILTTVIPKLVAQRNALVLCVDSAAARAKANQENKRIYYTTMSPDSADFAITRGKGYDFVDPVNNTDNTPEADKVAGINRAILAWTNLIKQNEKEKVNAQYTTDKKTYSVAGGSTLTYSETVTYGSKYNEMPFNMGGSAGASNLSNIWGSAINKTIQTLLQVGGKADSITIENEVPGSKFSFSLKPIANISTQLTYAASEQKSRTYGYTLSPDPFGYMDVQVMRMKDTISDFYQNAEDTLALTGEKANGTLQSYSSFIFRRLAGASRCPWENADSTLFYQPGTQLNNTTARLENPQITIAQREISNVPADQKAIFQIALSNEQTYDIGYGTKAMTFDLTLMPNCNPNGLKVTIDGQPITTIPMNIRISHGTTVYKTVEVERGEGYDFENITLKLGSTCDIQSFSLASFSVHFVPAATAVSMPSPHDQWVLNTQSAHDSAGYYIPVSIDGFDIHSDGFDHIELQYKPHTASDADWVNICSYYVSDSLYEQASGTKQRITGSKIDNIRFYGGRDPMEQEYDLRAMAFARYGNGFVTRASEVLHGVKDTRRPELFGTPTPADGILSVGDVLSLRFSEPIAGNLLDEDVNFEVIGTDDVLSLTTSLHFTGEFSCSARTKVTRNMNARPFTIEAMIKPTGNAALQTIFALDNEKEPLWFAWAGDHLEAQIGKVRLQSATVAPILDFTRVALTYNLEDSIARFFVGTQEVNYKIMNDEDNENNAKPSYHSAGQLIWGNNATYDAPFQGDMLEARLWTKALTQAELARYKDCHLTGYERELVAYYPMNEGKGTTCEDKANGATLTLNGTSWVLPEGMSIHLNGAEPICLNGDLLSRSDIEDLTLLISFKADENLADTSELLHAGKHTMHLTSDALLWRTDSTERRAPGAFADAQWHQLVVAIDRTRNIASLLVDGNTLLATAADDIPAFADSVWTLGQSFRGHIDAFTLFEQALPTYVIERYNNLAPQGDEMGLIAYMPFGQYILQPNGRYELVYSPENARIFRDADGNTVEKHQKLVMNDLTRYTDKQDFAPLRNGNARKKLNFSWASNGDELMININMPDHEINHRNLLLTVQRVEDQHGNAMLSPHTWAAYVYRQQLRWDNPQINYELRIMNYEGNANNINNANNAQPYTFTATIRNHGGTTREYHLNSLPSWLTAQPASGFLAPLETQTITFTVDEGLNIGEYTEYIYLTDDQQLDDRLLLNLHIKATCPWTLDQTELNRSMSLIGQVQIPAENGTIQIDTDSQDMVAAFVGEQCVALAPVRLNQQTKPVTYMTIYGNDSHAGKALRFQLWHSKNGKVYILAPSEDIPFRANECYGCEGTPITLTVTDRQVQQLTLQPGWNWFSLYLKPTYRSDLTRLFCSSDAWTNGDIIKNPEEQYFAEYQMNTSPIRWYGTLSTIRYRSIFLAHVSNPILLQIEGDHLDDEGRTLTLEQGWNVLPYLMTEKQSLTDALADYYDDASEGDLIKSRDAFAVFSHAGKWEGNLTYMQPGQG